MSLVDEHSTYYDVLDIKPEASPQEIREAYLRTKATYNRDSVALYSLISSEEREEMLERIEEAYHVLSSPEKRREYDIRFGRVDEESNIPLPARPPAHHKIISIDRFPPMDSEGEDLLIAPPTDFGNSERPPEERETSPSASPTPPPPPIAETRETARSENLRRERGITEEIAMETEFRGPFLRKVRESRRISVEEMASITKINKAYLLALEDENFQKLPATVFVRGFVNQVARTLRLPAEKVVAAYMVRYSAARPEKQR